MIIEVIAASEPLPDTPIRVEFGREGGTIGRADSNRLPLPDPRRTVSRVHAQVVLRQEGMRIIARSANALSVDGQTVDIGEEAALAEGSTIVIGDYTLRASHTGS